MGNLFSMDNKFFSALSKFADLAILNIVFLITCIPIFTIGAATTSLYEVTMKMVKDEESYVIRGYLKAFKSNFKQSTLMFLIVAVVIGILVTDIMIIDASSGTFWSILEICVIAFLFVAIFIVSYVFPVQAKFVNNIKNTLKNATILSIRFLPKTVVIVILNIIFPICMGWTAVTMLYGVLAYTLIGFSLVAFLNSFFFVKIFDKIIEEANTLENPEETDVLGDSEEAEETIEE